MIIKRNIIFSLENRKKDGKAITKNVPIRMRVNYASQRIEFTTGYRIDADKWNETEKRVKKNCINKLQQTACDINSDLDKYSNFIQDIFKHYEVQGIMPTPKQVKKDFNDKLDNKTINFRADNLIEIFDDFINESSKNNNWTTSTITKFRVLKDHIKNFDENISFHSLDEDRLNELVEHFLKKKHANSTISKNIDLFKWFLRWAVKKGYNKNNTFETFEPNLKIAPKKVIFLNMDEVNKLRNYKIPKTKQYLERVRDVFLYQCFTGLRYSDVYNLKKSDIKENHIEVTTIKTTDSLTIELNSYSRAILNKYKDSHFDNNKALPVVTNNNMNLYLKELGELAGLNEPINIVYYEKNERKEQTLPKYFLLGTHAGRRTFICISLSKGIPVETIMKWTGHSDYKAMKPYLDVSDKDRKKAMTLWNKEEKKKAINKEDLIKELKKLPKDELKNIFKKLIA